MTSPGAAGTSASTAVRSTSDGPSATGAGVTTVPVTAVCGRSISALPQPEGAGPSSNTSSPPARISSSVSTARGWGRPFKDTDCT